jgi:hypothetical protein
MTHVMARRIAFVSAVCGLVLVGTAGQAGAQPAAGSGSRWTIEVFGGVAAGSEGTSGSVAPARPAGAPFTTEAGRPSRQVPSWFFGDGALLLNQVIEQFEGISGASLPRMVSLDAALGRSAATRAGGAAFGVRLGRAIGDRLAVDVSVERSLTSLGFTDEVSAALDASSDAFEAAFNGLLATAPVTMLAVNSQVKRDDRSSSQTRIDASVRWTVARRGRLEAYLRGGGGVVLNSGDAPRAVINGNYSFRLFGFFAMQETDRVVIELTQPKSAAMGAVGAGFTYDLSASTGVRVDARLSLSRNATTVMVSGSPSITTQASGDVLPSATTPGIQFSSRAGVLSSLSAPATTWTTFSGSGLSRHVAVSIGLFRRF